MTGQELTVADRIEWARALAPSAMLPAQYRGHPENLLYAAEYADAVGVPRITILTSIFVIDGKPAAQADLIQSLVRRAGHKLRVRVAEDSSSVTATLIRADDPDYEFTSTWTLERAATAGLAKGNNWTKYPVAMMSARAITEVSRQGAAEALLGIRYTPEELGAEVIDEEGTPAHPTALAASAPIEGTAREATRDWAAEVGAADTVEALRDVWASAREDGALLDTVDGVTVRSMLELRASELQVSPGEESQEPPVTDDQVVTIVEWQDTLGWNAGVLAEHVRKVVRAEIGVWADDLTESEAARVIVSLSALSETTGMEPML